MVRHPAAYETAEFMNAYPSLSFGLHGDLGEWVLRAGEWEPVYTVVPFDDAAAVASEIDRQIELFRRMTGRLPSHLDTHQHVHQREPARSAISQAAKALGVPARLLNPHIRYCGAFYGQNEDGSRIPNGVSVKALNDILENLSPGMTELACHPAADIDFQSDYSSERIEELRVLCDPRIRQTLTRCGIRLQSFSEWSAVHRPTQ